MSFIKVLLVLSIVANVGLSEEISAECTKHGYFSSNNCLESCYRMVTAPHDWFHANKVCRISGGRLVAIETLEEQAFIEHLIRTTPGMEDGYMWTAGNEIATKHDWVWHGWNTKFDFTYWDSGEPNDYRGWPEHCMGLSTYGHTDNKWHDITCDTKLSFMCEKKM